MRWRSGNRVLVIDTRGVTIEYRRPAVGGGTYVRDLQTWVWPWRTER